MVLYDCLVVYIKPQRSLIFRALKSYQDKSHNQMKRKQQDQEVGILKLFRINSPHYSRKKRRFLPVILKVRLKKGAEPVFLNYQTMRQQYTDMLLEFYEQKVMFRNMDEELPIDPDHQLSAAQGQYNSIEAKEYSESKKQESVVKVGRKRRGRRQKVQHLKEEQIRSQSLDARPMRSCRLRSDHPRANNQSKDENHAQEGIEDISNREEPQPEKPEPVEEKKKALKVSIKKILDYDSLVESEGRQSLISPAVIPSVKVRQQIALPNPVVTYPLVARISYSDMEKDPFSQEEFKQSQQSEFVLDERGKQKRKKEKLLREQEKLRKSKKFRRIKKKHKMGKS